MSDRQAYFERAQSWADDARLQTARSRRAAWIVAGVAVAVALFEAVALALLTPLKTVQPVTLLVDRHTGYVQAIDPLTPRRIAADDALTQAYLAQYVAAREGFDRATVATDYRRVALWSAGRARSSYLSQMPATNPASPFQRYPAGTSVRVRVKSVSRLQPGMALVRFDTEVNDRSGSSGQPQSWISLVRFRFVDAPMQMEDRLVNPLGFQVTGYRRDAEAPPPPVQVHPPASAVIGAVTPTAPQTAIVETRVRPRDVMPAAASKRAVDNSSSRAQARPSERVVDRREVPINALPLGSPLSPSGAAFEMADASRRR